MYFFNSPLNFNYCVYYKQNNFLSDPECSALDDYFKLKETFSGKTMAGDKQVESEHRVCDVASVVWEKKIDWLFTKFNNLITDINSKHWFFDIVGIREPMQYIQYCPGGKYVFHKDCGNGAISNRKITVVTLLNDPDEFEGGSFQMFGDDEEIKLTRGSSVIFPSYEVHRVNEITSGNRRVLVTWVHGPPFR